MKRTLTVTAFMASLLLASSLFSACSSSSERQNRKRIEITQIVESKSGKDLLNDLYIGSDGDMESLSRMLGVTPSSLERIRTGQTVPTTDFEKRITDVSVYYALNKQSYIKLRHSIDDGWRWYESVLYWPKLNPWSFWVINIVLLLICAFAFVLAIWPILIELLLFLIVWLCALIFSPSPVQDNYTEMINPVVERLL